MLEKIRKLVIDEEPLVFLCIIPTAVVLTALVLAGVITVDQIDNGIQVFWRVLALVVIAAGALIARSKVTPTGKD